MIGIVTPEFQAVMKFTIGGFDEEIEIEAMIDTGFNGFLSLHPSLILHLGLTQSDIKAVELADGSTIETRIYRANIFWADQTRAVEVMELTGDNVIGMRLLHNHEIHIEVRDGGIVEIQPLKT